MTRGWSIDALPGCLLALSLAACAEHKDVMVTLDAYHPASYDPRHLDVQAQVTGAQSGLHYKWFSQVGEFDPQESYTPKTSYTFASNSPRDRVWVEVWRENERVAESHLDVSMSTPENTVSAPRPRIELVITEVPPYDPAGGPDTRANIAGKVTGQLSKDYNVVVYARADAWYIQPAPYSLQPILPDGSWKTWTHTGSNYAVLVVRGDYKPMTRLDVLPAIEGDVLARTIVEGKKR